MIDYSIVLIMGWERFYWNENFKVNGKVEKEEMIGEIFEEDYKEIYFIIFIVLEKRFKIIIVEICFKWV